MRRLPRSIFRSRRHRPQPYVEAIVEAARKAKLEPGVFQARVWHRLGCQRPRGGECTCSAGEIDVELVSFEHPERN
jgi:hypothetical protein